MDLKLRPPTSADVDAISQIVYLAFKSIAEKHNFPLDFPDPAAARGLAGMFVSHPSIFGVVSEADGRIVGSNFLDCRNSIAGVGPITVDPTAHGRGIGRRLMHAVMQRAADVKAPSVRLCQDAFNTTSISLYTTVGFDVKEPLALMQGNVRAKPSSAVEVRPLREDDLPACADLCRRVHGFDRVNELRDAIAAFRPFVLLRDGRIVAYASAPTFWPLNHGVGETEDDLQQLLAGASAATHEPLTLLVPTRRSGLFRWCLTEGLRMVKPMTLMATGDYREPQGAFYPSVQY